MQLSYAQIPRRPVNLMDLKDKDQRQGFKSPWRRFVHLQWDQNSVSALLPGRSAANSDRNITVLFGIPQPVTNGT